MDQEQVVSDTLKDRPKSQATIETDEDGALVVIMESGAEMFSTDSEQDNHSEGSNNEDVVEYVSASDSGSDSDVSVDAIKITTPYIRESNKPSQPNPPNSATNEYNAKKKENRTVSKKSSFFTKSAVSSPDRIKIPKKAKSFRRKSSMLNARRKSSIRSRAPSLKHKASFTIAATAVKDIFHEAMFRVVAKIEHESNEAAALAGIKERRMSIQQESLLLDSPNALNGLSNSEQDLFKFQEEEAPDLSPQVLGNPPELTVEQIELLDDLISRLYSIEIVNYTSTNRISISEENLMMICDLAIQQFLSEPTLLELPAPINIIGDIHGQFKDLLRFFELGGKPPVQKYLFLGDYIDRGNMGIECVLLLFCYKLKYPDALYMMRGNHECAAISRIYGFFDECRQYFSVKTWKKFNEVWDVLPLAATIGDTIFCTHGGLSPKLYSLNSIRNIHRPIDVPETGLLCDLLWADPTQEEEDWAKSERGISQTFGEHQLAEFLDNNDFELFVRAHQVVENGYEFFPKDKRLLVTLFSAANYCGQFDNAAAMMVVQSDLVCSFKIICPTEHKTRMERKIRATNLSSPKIIQKH